MPSDLGLILWESILLPALTKVKRKPATMRIFTGDEAVERKTGWPLEFCSVFTGLCLLCQTEGIQKANPCPWQWEYSARLSSCSRDQRREGEPDHYGYFADKKHEVHGVYTSHLRSSEPHISAHLCTHFFTYYIPCSLLTGTPMSTPFGSRFTSLFSALLAFKNLHLSNYTINTLKGQLWT